MVRFGQIVIGAPGAGKSTYCRAAGNYLNSINRETMVINLDPAVKSPDAAIDICALVEHAEVMEEMELGPNGGLIFCMELLLENKEWLLNQINRIPNKTYLLFDFPGQAELYSVHDCVERLINYLTKELDIRLCALYFTESRHASDPHIFTAALLATLSSMLRLSLPSVNILSKIDTAPRLPARLETFTDPVDLSFLFDQDDDEEEMRKKSRRRRIREKISLDLADVASSYGLVRFQPLVVTDERLIRNVILQADQAIGLSLGNEDLLLTANRETDFEFMGSTAIAQEDYIDANFES